jgi:hypothetical protein
VSIQAGTYSETVTIQGTQTVTIAGPTASIFANNQVNIAASATAGVVSFNTQKSSGVVFRNVNITNTISAPGTKAPALYVSGSNMLLDTVALVSGGLGVYQAGLGTTLITNSYIEGIVPTIHNESQWSLTGFRCRQAVLYICHSLRLQLCDRPNDIFGFYRIPSGLFDQRRMVQLLLGHRLKQRTTETRLEQHLRIPSGSKRELHGRCVSQHRTGKSDCTFCSSLDGVHEGP